MNRSHGSDRIQGSQVYRGTRKHTKKEHSSCTTSCMPMPIKSQASPKGVCEACLDTMEKHSQTCVHERTTPLKKNLTSFKSEHDRHAHLFVNECFRVRDVQKRHAHMCSYPCTYAHLHGDLQVNMSMYSGACL